MSENIFIIIAGVLGLVALGLLIMIVSVVSSEISITDQYNQGKITLQQFCDQMTDNGTISDDVPVICYSVYQVKQIGTKEVMVGKVMRDKPILAPIN